MKKLLAMLGTVSIVVSSAAPVVACSNTITETKKPIKEAQSTIDIRNSSLDSVKSLIMADQFGLDVNKAQQTIDQLTNYSNPYKQYFNSQATSSITKGMNLAGTKGEQNKPIKDLINTINKTLNINIGQKLGIDLDSAMDTWANLISALPNLINRNNIEGTLQNLPTIIQGIAGLIHVDIGPKTIQDICEFIAHNVSWFYSKLDTNGKANDMIKNFSKYPKDANYSKPTLGWFADQGVMALTDLTDNILFRKFNSNKLATTDSNTSVFLGQRVLTPLLNGKKLSTDDFKDILDAKYLGSYIFDIVDNISVIITSLNMIMNFYHQYNNYQTTDSSALFSSTKNEDFFKENDKNEVTPATDGFTIGNTTIPKLSWDTTVYDIYNNIKNTDNSTLGILKLTNIFFHEQYDEKGNKYTNPLLSKLMFMIIDSLKYTDYHVKTTLNAVKVNDDLKEISIDDKKYEIKDKETSASFDLDFYLKDLVIPTGKQINIANASLFGLIKGDVSLNIKNNGLLDISDSFFAHYLSFILTGQNFTGPSGALWGYDAGTFFTFISSLIGKTNDDSFTVDLNSSPLYSTLNSQVTWKLFWSAIKPVIGFEPSDLFNDFVKNMYYSNDDKVINSLKGFLKLIKKDDIIPDLEKKYKDSNGNPLVTVSNIVYTSLKNSSYGDLTQIDKVFSIDKILELGNILLIQNTIQDDGTTESLLEQIATNLNSLQNINKYLGYTETPTGANSNYSYVRLDSFVGYLITMLYPEVKEGLTNVVIKDGSINVININALAEVEGNIDLIEHIATSFANSLKGESLDNWIEPMLKTNQDDVWTISDVINNNFSGSDNLQYESYTITFNPNNVVLQDGTKLKNQKTSSYKVWFSRTSSSDKFDFKEISKI